MFDIILILLPLFIGLACPLPQRVSAHADNALHYVVLGILFLVGLGLASLPGWHQQVGFILKEVLVLSLCSIGIGLSGVWLLDICSPLVTTPHQSSHEVSPAWYVSLLQLAIMGIGGVVGYFWTVQTTELHLLIKALLMLMLGLIGISLRQQGIDWRAIVFNRRGLVVCLILMLSTFLGGVIYSKCFHHDLGQSLAMLSGYGWYSLSGILITERYGALWGSVALMHDLVREMMAILFIPFLGKRFGQTAVALGGATSMDFTLGILRQSAGIKIVPLALGFGILINLAAPILMLLFSTFKIGF